VCHDATTLTSRTTFCSADTCKLLIVSSTCNSRCQKSKRLLTLFPLFTGKILEISGCVENLF
jgi:hypothetical protein